MIKATRQTCDLKCNIFWSPGPWHLNLTDPPTPSFASVCACVLSACKCKRALSSHFQITWYFSVLWVVDFDSLRMMSSSLICAFRTFAAFVVNIFRPLPSWHTYIFYLSLNTESVPGSTHDSNIARKICYLNSGSLVCSMLGCQMSLTIL